MNTEELNKVTMRMAIVFGILFMLNSLAFSILGAFTGQKWNMMDTQEKVLVCVGIAGSWTNVMMAYLSKTVARLQAGKLPPTNGTEHITKQSLDK